MYLKSNSKQDYSVNGSKHIKKGRNGEDILFLILVNLRGESESTFLAKNLSRSHLSTDS